MRLFYFHLARKPNFTKIRKISYDDYWRERGFELRNKLMEREVIFFDWIKPGSKVLDIACGNSRLLLDLKEKKQCDVTAMDISPLVVESQQKLGIKGIVANIDDANFQLPEHYDYIIASEIWEHLSQPEDLMTKIKSSTDHFVISSTNSAFYRYRIWLMFHGRFFTQWFSHPSEHLRYWSYLDFLDWLSAMGMEVEKTKPSNGFELRDLWPNMFGHQICYLAKVKQ